MTEPPATTPDAPLDWERDGVALLHEIVEDLRQVLLASPQAEALQLAALLALVPNALGRARQGCPLARQLVASLDAVFGAYLLHTGMPVSPTALKVIKLATLDLAALGAEACRLVLWASDPSVAQPEVALQELGAARRFAARARRDRPQPLELSEQERLALPQYLQPPPAAGYDLHCLECGGFGFDLTDHAEARVSAARHAAQHPGHFVRVLTDQVEGFEA